MMSKELSYETYETLRNEFKLKSPDSPEKAIDIFFSVGIEREQEKEVINFIDREGITLDIGIDPVGLSKLYRERLESRRVIELEYQTGEALLLYTSQIEDLKDKIGDPKVKQSDILRNLKKGADELFNPLEKKERPAPKNFLSYAPVKTKTILEIGNIKVPHNITCCFHAEGGTGKSVLLQRLAMAHSQVKTLFISGEDAGGVMANNLEPFKYLYSNSKADFLFLGGEDMDTIIEYIKTYNDYDLYIIDPLSSFCIGDKWGEIETKNGIAAELLAVLNKIASKGKTIIYTHHVNKNHKNGDIRGAARGSSALVDNARMGIFLHDIGEELRESKKPKISAFLHERQHAENMKAFYANCAYDVKKLYTPWNNEDTRLVKLVRATCTKSNYTAAGDSSLFALATKEGGLDIGRVDSIKDLSAYLDYERETAEGSTTGEGTELTPPLKNEKSENNNKGLFE